MRRAISWEYWPPKSRTSAVSRPRWGCSIACATSPDGAMSPAGDVAQAIEHPHLGRETALVLDFGGQYSQLIARRIRECGVFAELLPSSTPIEEIRARRPQALILSGGPASVYEPGAPSFR